MKTESVFITDNNIIFKAIPSALNITMYTNGNLYIRKNDLINGKFVSNLIDANINSDTEFITVSELNYLMNNFTLQSLHNKYLLYKKWFNLQFKNKKLNNKNYKYCWKLYKLLSAIFNTETSYNYYYQNFKI